VFVCSILVPQTPAYLLTGSLLPDAAQTAAALAAARLASAAAPAMHPSLDEPKRKSCNRRWTSDEVGAFASYTPPRLSHDEEC